MIPLRFTLRSNGAIVVELDYQNGVTSVVSCIERMRNDVNKWITHGIHEYLGDGADVIPRDTSSSEPEFLPRLKEYLDRQFDFDIKIG